MSFLLLYSITLTMIIMYNILLHLAGVVHPPQELAQSMTSIRYLNLFSLLTTCLAHSIFVAARPDQQGKKRGLGAAGETDDSATLFRRLDWNFFKSTAGEGRVRAFQRPNSAYVLLVMLVMLFMHESCVCNAAKPWSSSSKIGGVCIVC